MRNLVMAVLVIGLLSLLPLSLRVAPSSGLLPVSISVGQDKANAYVTYRRARVTYRRAYRRGYRGAYYGGAYYRPYTYGHYRHVHRRVARRAIVALTIIEGERRPFNPNPPRLRVWPPRSLDSLICPIGGAATGGSPPSGSGSPWEF
jgi:hypothetical protein